MEHSKWIVSEQSIIDSNGNQIIEASEWYMRNELQKICDMANNLPELQARIEELEKVFLWIKKQYNENFYPEELEEYLKENILERSIYKTVCNVLKEDNNG